MGFLDISNLLFIVFYNQTDFVIIFPFLKFNSNIDFDRLSLIHSYKLISKFTIMSDLSSMTKLKYLLQFLNYLHSKEPNLF